MDAKTREQAAEMALKLKAEGRSIFEQIVALRSEFRLSLTDAKDIYHQATHGEPASVSQARLASGLEAAILGMEPA